ncbi:hypothetical protein KEM48_003390 [Puccinia striiformis f. sp. tritici PST-130]|nr:hypothetical protein KEM48_003390 [Puccinia striiformis f. sp. tritici PST-130]
MLHQNRVIMIAFLISLLAISPISTLPSETTYPTLSAKATSRKSHSDSAQRPENGQLREQSTHQGDATCKFFLPNLIHPPPHVVSVVDRCEGCSPDDLDLSPAAFRRLSPLNTGRLHGIRWSFA